MPDKESKEPKAILILGADKEIASHLSRCLSQLDVKMCKPSKGEKVHDAVKRLLKEADCVGIIPDTEEKPEPLANALHSAGVKGLKFIWCLCHPSEELEKFFSRQPSEEVLVLDPDHFRKNLSSGCEQLFEFCELVDKKALDRAKKSLA
ncbi:MAG: hypothetical protein ACPGVU_13280 [Limisphaerales bacterium]